VQLLARPQAGEDDRDVDVGLEPAQADQIAREVNDAHGPSHLEHHDTVARFIESGGTLTIEAKPDKPLGIDKLAYLRRPGPDLVDMLGLSATLTK